MKFDFSSTVERIEEWGNYHVIPVPDPVSDKLRDAKVTRLIVSINGLPIRRAIQGLHEGGRFMLLGKAVLKEVGIQFGDVIEVEIEPDPDPDFVDIPVEFELTLDQEPAAKERWDTFTPGKQRSLCHFVSSAKQSKTRIKRSVELAQKIATYTLYGDKGPPEKGD